MENSSPSLPTAVPPTNGGSARVSATGREHSPTRERLLRLLEAQANPVTIAQLAAGSGCHENTVRGHLHALWRDGYATRTRDEHPGKGRPAWLWSAAAERAVSPYAGLAIALANGLADATEDPAATARAVGAEWGRSIGHTLPHATSARAAREAVFSAMCDQGFAPSSADQPNGTETNGADTNGAAEAITLHRCPLIAAAAHRPEIVCAVHLGVVTGVLEAVGAQDTGTELHPMSGPGECTLTLRASA